MADPLFADAFTGTENQELGDGTGGTHAPDVGTEWTYSTAERGILINDANQLKSVTDSTADVVLTNALGVTDYQIIFRIFAPNDARNVRVAGRMEGTSDYALGVSAFATNVIRATTRTNGSTNDGFSNLAITSVGIWVRLTFEGDACKLWTGPAGDQSPPADRHLDNNWTERVSVTNSVNNTVDQAGFLHFTSNGTASDPLIDDFEVYEYPVAGEPGVDVEGGLAATEAADTFEATAEAIVAGDLAATEQTDTLAAVAEVAVEGDLAATEAADTFEATGEVTAEEVDEGTFNAVEAPDTAVFTSEVLVAGSLTVTEAGDSALFNVGRSLRWVILQRPFFTKVKGLSVLIYSGEQILPGEITPPPDAEDLGEPPPGSKISVQELASFPRLKTRIRHERKLRRS